MLEGPEPDGRVTSTSRECASPDFDDARTAELGLASAHGVSLGLIAGGRLSGHEATLGLHRGHGDATLGEAGDDLAVIAMLLAIGQSRPVGIPRIPFTESVTIGGTLRAMGNGAIRDRWPTARKTIAGIDACVGNMARKIAARVLAVLKAVGPSRRKRRSRAEDETQNQDREQSRCHGITIPPSVCQRMAWRGRIRTQPRPPPS